MRLALESHRLLNSLAQKSHHHMGAALNGVRKHIPNDLFSAVRRLQRLANEGRHEWIDEQYQTNKCTLTSESVDDDRFTMSDSPLASMMLNASSIISDDDGHLLIADDESLHNHNLESVGAKLCDASCQTDGIIHFYIEGGESLDTEKKVDELKLQESGNEFLGSGRVEIHESGSSHVFLCCFLRRFMCNKC